MGFEIGNTHNETMRQMDFWQRRGGMTVGILDRLISESDVIGPMLGEACAYCLDILRQPEAPGYTCPLCVRRDVRYERQHFCSIKCLYKHMRGWFGQATNATHGLHYKMII